MDDTPKNSWLNKFSLILGVVLLIVVGLLGWQFFTHRTKVNQQPVEKDGQVLPAEIEREEIKITVIIDNWSETGLTFNVGENTSVLDILKMINSQQPEFNLQTKDYAGVGTLVEQIGDKINGQNNKYWQYLVNKEQPLVSADQYLLKDNDQIEWHFAPIKF